MLLVGSALKGFTIEASDGSLGVVSDFLFDDKTWKIRWMVVKTGTWLAGREVLIHPSAIGTPDYTFETLPVRLTRAQVKGSPDIATDEPVSRQMQHTLYGYWGYDPMWGGGGYFGGYPYAAGMPFGVIPNGIGSNVLDKPRGEPDGDHDLRSLSGTTGYHIHATDGTIGHIENILVDAATWQIRYLVIDTKNWWPGQRVLLSPYAVRDISWSEREVHLNTTRAAVKSSSPWNPVDMIDQISQERLHSHYGWPGYGW